MKSLSAGPYLREGRVYGIDPPPPKCWKFFSLDESRKIIKFVATKCHILRLKCTKFDLGWGFAPDPAGELTALCQTP